MKQAKSPLAKFMSDGPVSSNEMERLRHRAWTEQNILMLSPSDSRLTDDQRNFLYMIAESRYGYGGAK